MNPVPAVTATSFLISEAALEDCFTEIAEGEERWRIRAESHRIVFDFDGGRGAELILGLISRKFGSMCIRAGETSAAEVLKSSLLSHGIRLVSAESCTGGLIAKMLTDIAGSSSVFWGGYVTYANDAKERMLSVSSLSQHGAVSRETAIEMASGAIDHSGADIAIAVSGIAGPDGGTAEKPVGTVYIGIKLRHRKATAWQFLFRGDRDQVRTKSAIVSMLLAEATIENVSVDNEPFRAYI